MKTKMKLIISLLVFISILIVFIIMYQKPNGQTDVIKSNDEIAEIKTEKNKEVPNDEDKQVSINDDADNLTEIENPEKKQNERISLFISKYHESLNEITSYDKYENIDWLGMKSIKENMSNEIKNLLNNQDSYPPSMELDLERILQLAEISLDNQDPNSVIYIHRILHDLDVEYNDYTPNNKFGFSNYDGGGENQLTVSNYIKEHKKPEDTY
ncbi:hypothetical protein ABE096_03925 [Robertmurraya massiliosenegalensis]|uniref:hypothetical protein n=1 Tax=Bacillaceae TaxID=186817 RepID=UPI0002FD09E9|nr:hypothetical protein [Robertmurraya massiliosenegalensis]